VTRRAFITLVGGAASNDLAFYRRDLWMMIILILEKQMGHKPYGHVPRLGKIAIWLVLIVIACGLVLFLAVWTNLIQ
jgi:hypothetical protein